VFLVAHSAGKKKWEVHIDSTPIMAGELTTDDLASKYNAATAELKVRTNCLFIAD
jgi:hypothetical protein